MYTQRKIRPVKRSHGVGREVGEEWNLRMIICIEQLCIEHESEALWVVDMYM